jgi:hypothetical protein
VGRLVDYLLELREQARAEKAFARADAIRSRLHALGISIEDSLRVVGVVFLVVMALGELPAAFALPAGLGDIAIGLSAPFLARRLRRGEGHGSARRFNLLGILDLVVALSIGFLAGLGPWTPIDVTPTTEPLTLLPLALVPTVAVPTAIALHVMSLAQLRSLRRTREREAMRRSRRETLRMAS